MDQVHEGGKCKPQWVAVYMLFDSGGDQWRKDYTVQVENLGPLCVRCTSQFTESHATRLSQDFAVLCCTVFCADYVRWMLYIMTMGFWHLCRGPEMFDSTAFFRAKI